jgi:hypothetical protein
MDWRDGFLKSIAPGSLAGITFGDWTRLLATNGFRVPVRYWPRVASTTLSGLINTALGFPEEAIFGRRIASQQVLPPIFVLGHYRSGTSHLHNLLAVDHRFAYPTFTEVMFPRSFLLGGAVVHRVGRFLLPPTRLGMDNMAFHTRIPWEEEYALALTTLFSPYLGFCFPCRAGDYERYLTFRGVPPSEVERWKAAYLAFVKKVTWKHKRPLILKSPANTCRIRLLLEIFPQAKFVHIHRNPYIVYQSTRRMAVAASPYHRFQQLENLQVMHERIIRQYQIMYDAFFEEKTLIPAGRFCEVAFEDLESDPVGQLRRIYEELSLPDFAGIESAFKDYVSSLIGYRKNAYPDLPPALRSEISGAWCRSFDEWGYRP